MTRRLRHWCDQAALCLALLAVCIVVPVLAWLEDVEAWWRERRP